MSQPPDTQNPAVRGRGSSADGEIDDTASIGTGGQAVNAGPLSAIVSRYVELRPKGRMWAGLSPFRPEKTPSFFVDDMRAEWHDFGTGWHGDAAAFLARVEAGDVRRA